MQLKIQERQSGAVTILELEGPLLLGPGADVLREYIKKLLKAGKSRIILQLEKLGRLDSVGVGTMLDAVKAARNAGGDVRLLQPSRPAHEVLELLKLRNRPDLLRIFLDEQEALESFRVSARPQ